MTTIEIVIAGFGLLVAGVVKGTTGLGYASCAMPFLVFAFGMKPAMIIVILPSLATNVSLAIATGQVRKTVTRFRWLYLTIPPGIAVGIYILERVNQTVSIRAFGIVTVGYAIMALTRPRLRLPVRFEAPLQWPTGFLNGVVTGLTGAQVMPLFPYVMALQLDPNLTVQVVNLAVLIASTSLAIGLIVSGALTPQLFVASVIALIPALAGVELGNCIRSRIPVQHFRTLALAALLMLGALMLTR